MSILYDPSSSTIPCRDNHGQHVVSTETLLLIFFFTNVHQKTIHKRHHTCWTIFLKESLWRNLICSVSTQNNSRQHNKFVMKTAAASPFSQDIVLAQVCGTLSELLRQKECHQRLPLRIRCTWYRSRVPVWGQQEWLKKVWMPSGSAGERMQEIIKAMK